MSHYVDKCNGDGITLKDLKDFIKECDKTEIPDNTPIYVPDLDLDIKIPIKRIIGDEEDIMFYYKI